MINDYVGNALYWAQVAENIEGFGVALAVGMAIFLFFKIFAAEMDHEKVDIRWPIRILAFGVIISLVAGLVPNRETILLSVGVNKGAAYAERLLDLVEKATP